MASTIVGSKTFTNVRLSVGGERLDTGPSTYRVVTELEDGETVTSIELPEGGRLRVEQISSAHDFLYRTVGDDPPLLVALNSDCGCGGT